MIDSKAKILNEVVELLKEKLDEIGEELNSNGEELMPYDFMEEIIEDARIQTKYEIAFALLENNVGINTITKVTGIDKEELKKLI